MAALAGLTSDRYLELSVGHRSVYPSQVLGMFKAGSVRVQAGAKLGSVRGVDVRTVRLRRTATILKALRKRRGDSPAAPLEPVRVRA